MINFLVPVNCAVIYFICALILFLTHILFVLKHFLCDTGRHRQKTEVFNILPYSIDLQAVKFCYQAMLDK